MEIFSLDFDNVIKAHFLTGRVTYKYALENIVNLIDKLDIQRKFQNESFYKRLEIDLKNNCIMPAITIAYIKELIPGPSDKNDLLKKYLEQNIKSAFILDGIQRLNTLKRIYQKEPNELDLNKFLYLNLIICPSKDNLLYRMVTLNNGQKPMTARHQIEILASSMYDFSSYSFKVFTEKENDSKSIRSFKKSDILNSYISFLSNSTSLDNNKIIESKLDELIARKIIESKITDETIDYSKVLDLIDKMSHSEVLYNWLKNGNNLIGFCVGIRTSFKFFISLKLTEIEDAISEFEKVFKNINVSKIKLSRERRKLSSYYISNIKDLISQDSDEITLLLAEQI